MRLIRPKAMPAKVGLSLSTIWRMEKAGLFPRRRKLSPGAVGWLESEINEWLQSRKAV